MRRRQLFLSAALIVFTACGSSSRVTSTRKSSTSTTSGATPTKAAAVQSAALAWAHAFLTGTVYDFDKLQGPECRTGVKLSPSNEAAATADLQQLRRQIEERAGQSTAAIEATIKGVTVRDLTDTTAEAEVRYDLPESVTGNDNWVTFQRIDGTWKVADCIAPFGGSSSSKSASSPAP